MPQPPRNILGLGTIVVDLQMLVDRFPARDSKIEAISSRTQIGGPVPTALALLSRFGHRCRFSGVWGHDPAGTLVEHDLIHKRIEFSPAQSRTSLTGTGTAHVWVEPLTGHRTVVCHRAEPAPDSLQSAVADATEFDALHLDGWPGPAAVAAARAMKAAGGTVCLDTGSPKSETDNLLRLADVVNCPLHFVRTHLQTENIRAAGESLLALGPRIVTITDGARGAWMFTREGNWHQPAFPIDAVDTNGAGDIFAGGLLHAVLQQWEPPTILRFASACAAIKCTNIGNRDALPSLNEVEQFLNRQPNQE